MIHAQEAILQTLRLNIGILVFNLILIVISFTNKKAYKTYLHGIALCIILVVQIVLFVPFVKDCKNNNIVIEQGYYENLNGGRGSSFSDIVGSYGVSLYTDEGEIRLTTAPWKEDVFIIGKYHVVAYYLPESKTLLHIEFIENEGDEPYDSPNA